MANSIDSAALTGRTGDETLLQLTARNRVRLLKSAAGLVLLSVGSWYGYGELVLTRSTDATVSAEFAPISAPIEGYLQLRVRGRGETVDEKGALLAIENPLLDRREIIDLETKLSSLDGEIGSMTGATAGLQALNTKFESRGRSYLRQRAEQLEVSIEQSRARLDVQEAKLVSARKQLQRVEDMAKAGVASIQQGDEARRDAAVAESGVADAKMAIELQQASLKASKEGVTIGDYSSTDRSYSNQRADEISLNLAQLGEQLAEKQARRTALATGLAELTQQMNLLRYTQILAPTRSRVWTLLTGDKQWVSRGQPLLRVMSCTQMHVLAYLSRRKFDAVHVGQAVRIELKADARKFTGKVVLTIGKHTTPDLVQPLSADDNYAVLIDSSEMGQALQGACDTGQRAEVTFMRGRWGEGE